MLASSKAVSKRFFTTAAYFAATILPLLGTHIAFTLCTPRTLLVTPPSPSCCCCCLRFVLCLAPSPYCCCVLGSSSSLFCSLSAPDRPRLPCGPAGLLDSGGQLHLLVGSLQDLHSSTGRAAVQLRGGHCVQCSWRRLEAAAHGRALWQRSDSLLECFTCAWRLASAQQPCTAAAACAALWHHQEQHAQLVGAAAAAAAAFVPVRFFWLTAYRHLPLAGIWAGQKQSGRSFVQQLLIRCRLFGNAAHYMLWLSAAVAPHLACHHLLVWCGCMVCFFLLHPARSAALLLLAAVTSPVSAHGYSCRCFFSRCCQPACHLFEV